MDIFWNYTMIKVFKIQFTSWFTVSVFTDIDSSIHSN